MLAVHHDVDAGFQEADRKKPFGKILQAVASFKAERSHGSRQHNRNSEVPQRALQVETRI